MSSDAQKTEYEKLMEAVAICEKLGLTRSANDLRKEAEKIISKYN